MTSRPLLLLCIVLPFCAPKNNAQELTRAEAVADLQHLRSEIESYHSGYTRYTSSDSLAYYFDRAERRLEDCSVVDFYKEIRFIVSMIRCGHTRASLPNLIREAYEKSRVFLPVSVVILNNRVYVTESLAPGKIKPGDEILTINNDPISEILETLYAHQSSDGHITTGKAQLTALFFSFYYQLYFGNTADSYEVQTVNSSVVLEGAAWQDVRQLRTPPPAQSMLELAHEEDYSYLRIGSFSQGSLQGNYTSFLSESFQTLQDRGVKNLILDLRRNGGGKDEWGALLVSYLLSEPFGYFERIEVTDAYEGYGSVERSRDRNLMTSHSGLDQQSIQASNFKGTVYLLADGWTFSTAADVVSVLDNADRVFIVGEETGGGRHGNTSGASDRVLLQNSRIRVNVPMWKYTTALSDPNDVGRGVIPDAQVVSTIKQHLNKEDVQLNYCLELIGGQ